jgi:hypothetical protein
MPNDYRNWASVLSQVTHGSERARGRGAGRGGGGTCGGRGEGRGKPRSLKSVKSAIYPFPSPQVFLKKEGTEQGAADALARVMLAAHGHLAKVANGEELFPRFHLADPVFASELADLPAALEDVVSKVRVCACACANEKREREREGSIVHPFSSHAFPSFHHHKKTKRSPAR